MHEYLKFNNKYVRALLWLLRSPSLLSNPPSDQNNRIKSSDKSIVQQDWGETIYQQYHDWFIDLDQNPQALEDAVNGTRSYRLGVRVEVLLNFLFVFLHQQGEFKQYVKSLAVKDETKQDLGELDFIWLNNEKDSLIHWEVANKYYLFRPEEFAFERFSGVNGNDWLSHKIEHLFRRQLGITNTYEAKLAIRQHFQMDMDLKIQSKAFFKGILFYPLNENIQLNNEEKAMLNPDGLSGWWTYPDKFYQADPEQVCKWKVISKLDWIVPQFYPYQEESILNHKEMFLTIKHHFAQSKRSMMLAKFRLDEQSQLWLEQDRGVIVDPLWPSYKRDKLGAL